MCVCITSVEGPVPEGARKFLVYSLHDNAIGTKHIGGAPIKIMTWGPLWLSTALVCITILTFDIVLVCV